MTKRSTYHHGDLKAALVDAALQLIAERGVDVVSVAEVARRVQVSSGAPYRHFPNRQALLIAAAIAAARRLAAELEAVWSHSDDGEPLNPIEATAAAAGVYARFTVEHGAGFDLIFADELRGSGDEELLEAGRRVMDALLPAVLTVTNGDAKKALELLERQIAAAHGYAALLRSGFLQRRQPTVDDVAEHASAIARTLSQAAQRATGT